MMSLTLKLTQTPVNRQLRHQVSSLNKLLQQVPKNISLGDELDIDKLLEGPELPPEGLPR